MISYNTSGIVALCLLVSCGVSVNAQQKPSFNTEQFSTNVTHRQNVCDRQEKLYNEEVKLRDALSGLALRPGVFHNPDEYFQLQEDGTIDPDNLGLIAVLLDELGRRANFTWRDSFGVTVQPELTEGRTFTDLLLWTVNTYDMSADWYPNTIERLNLGISFQQKWYDADIVLVQEKMPAAAEFNPFSWTDPFGAGVWATVLATVVVSALVYRNLERLDHKTDKLHLEESLSENVFLSAIAFTGHLAYQPQTNPARLYIISLTFLALLITSAYTANLASFLVVRKMSKVDVASIDDVIRLGLRICVSGLTDAQDVVVNLHPNTRENILRKSTEVDMFQAVRNGECDVAITTAVSWRLHEENRKANPDCSLQRVGSVVKAVPASFAFVSDSGTLCTSLIRDVLHLHMAEMVSEGFIEQAWETERLSRATLTCQTVIAGTATEDESGTLTLKDIGGVFITHYTMTAFALLYVIFANQYKEYKKRQDERCEAGVHAENLKEKSLADDDTLARIMDEREGGGSLEDALAPSSGRSSVQLDSNLHIEAVIDMLRAMQSEEALCPDTAASGERDGPRNSAPRKDLSHLRSSNGYGSLKPLARKHSGSPSL